MEITEIIAQLKDKFGDKVDITKATAMLKGMDHKNMSFNEIVSKLNLNDLVGDLDGDGKKEGLIEELKGKFGSFFGK